MPSNDDVEFDVQDEEFDPDLFGPDRKRTRSDTSREVNRRRATGRGASKPVGANGSGSQPLEAAGKPEATAENSCFSAPDPWLETHRAAPSELLRCGLFGVRRRAGEFVESRRLDTNANVELTVKGPELSQLDLDMWTAVVHLLRFGTPAATLSRLKLLAAWGRGRGGNADQILRSSLIRTHECEITLDVQNRPSRKHPEQIPDRYRFEGRLIDRVEWQEGEKHPVSIPITLNPGLSVLFERQRRTILFPSHRAAIGDNPVARWLYGMLRSHRQVLPLPLLYYYRMSGSRSSVPDFARQMKRALTLLADKRIIFSAELRRDGLVLVQRHRPTVARRLPAEDTEWYVLGTRQPSVSHE